MASFSQHGAQVNRIDVRLDDFNPDSFSVYFWGEGECNIVHSIAGLPISLIHNLCTELRQLDMDIHADEIIKSTQGEQTAADEAMAIWFP